MSYSSLFQKEDSIEYQGDFHTFPSISVQTVWRQFLEHLMFLMPFRSFISFLFKNR
uniref:Uncharacterized protein n=1 Tax=viral metagenome TaxID=1070528 RepID=A0A6C0D0G5_9ZZZZ